MADNLTDYAEKKLLDHITRAAAYTMPTALYIGLYTAAPSDTGGGTEVTLGSYARQTIAFGAATGTSPTLASNTGIINFTGMPACTVTHAAIFDAIAGNMLWHGPLVGSVVVGVGETFSFLAGDVDLTLG